MDNAIYWTCKYLVWFSCSLYTLQKSTYLPKFTEAMLIVSIRTKWSHYFFFNSFWKPPSRACVQIYNVILNPTKVPILKEVNFGKMQLCRVEHLLNTFSTYLSSILDSPSPMFWLHSVESNFDDKNVEKVFNKCSTQQSFIFPKFTSFKIGTLGT